MAWKLLDLLEDPACADLRGEWDADRGAGAEEVAEGSAGNS